MILSIGILKAVHPHCIQHVVHLLSSAASDFVAKGNATTAALLKNVDNKWVAFLSLCNHQTAASLEEEMGREWKNMARVVEWRHYSLFCEQGNTTDDEKEEGAEEGDKLKRIKVGDVVSVRRIHAGRSRQEMAEYSCLAALRSYYGVFKGLQWCGFYKCSEGKRIVGLGIWQSLQNASSVLISGSPAEAFWMDLGVKSLYYSVSTVVFGARAPNHLS